MLDIKILLIKDILPVYRVEMAKGIQPQTLDVIGDSLSQATQVLINDVPAPEFMVLSPSHLLAQVPPSLRQTPITKISVLAEKPSTNRSSLLYFDTGPTVQSLAGIERMIQSFCRLLLQTPGSDRFNPNEGGGLLSVVGQTMTSGSASSLASSVMHSVSQARDQLVAKQNKNLRIPPDERLLKAEVTNTSFQPKNTMFLATVAIAAMSGQQAVANLTS